MNAPLPLRLALLAYPAHMRAAHGAELVGTALDAIDARASSRLREAFGLVAGGLQARGGTEAAASPRDVWLGGLRLAALPLAVVNAAIALSGLVATVMSEGGWFFQPSLAWWIAATVAAALLLVGVCVRRPFLARSGAVVAVTLVLIDLVYPPATTEQDVVSQFDALTYFGANHANVPRGHQWLGATLVLAVAAVCVGRGPGRSAIRTAAAAASAIALAYVAAHVWGAFAFLLWPTIAVAVTILLLATLQPRLPVAGLLWLASAAPIIAGYVDDASVPHHYGNWVVSGVVAAATTYLSVTAAATWLSVRRPH